MVVLVEQIRETGLRVEEPIGQEVLARALEDGHETGFRVVQGSCLVASLEKISGGVLVRGEFEAVAAGPCKRCLADVEIRIPINFTLNLVPKSEPLSDSARANEAKAEALGSFRLEEADKETFDGRRIDLEPIVREQMLLALPMYVVCDEDCKGLCAVCGQNLNESSCGCEVTPVDPRLSVLKNIKLN